MTLSRHALDGWLQESPSTPGEENMKISTTTARLLTSIALAGVVGALAAGCGSGSRSSSGGNGAAGVGSGTTTAPGANGQTFTLTATVAGTGTGTVTIDPPSATNTWPAGTTLTLTAAADPGSVFVEWGGDLAGDEAFTRQIVLQNNFTLGPVFDVPAAGAPTADFTSDPNPAMWIAPLDVTFTDASGGTPTDWTWDFGDGDSDTAQNPTHTYSTPGTYTVTLRAKNASGMGLAIIRRDLVVVADPSEGSRHWYENDTYGNPFKTHDTASDALVQQVFALVNQERAAVGVAPLTYDAEAERAALAHTEDMVERGFFDHVTPAPESWTPGERLQMTGASGYSRTGENIATGQRTAAAVMQAWMNSPGHRANILDPLFTHIGVGVTTSGPTWAQVFLTR
jgi:uncharacterized protein YkwD